MGEKKITRLCYSCGIFFVVARTKVEITEDSQTQVGQTTSSIKWYSYTDSVRRAQGYNSADEKYGRTGTIHCKEKEMVWWERS